jgi:hypothetical protein
MQNQRIPIEIAIATMEGTRKRRPCKRWREEVEEDLNVIGIKIGKNDQRPSGIKEGCIGSEDTQRTVAPEKKKKKKKKKKETTMQAEQEKNRRYF